MCKRCGSLCGDIDFTYLPKICVFLITIISAALAMMITPDSA